MTKWTAETLIAFENDIAARFARAEIPYPVHLDGGNEVELIKYFATNYYKGEWICGTWRMHYKCLLAGVPENEVREAILAGHSITLCFPEYNIISSALVGHICSIAMGIAYGIQKQKARVHCFIGDMTRRTGAYYEAASYAAGHLLPINWIVEDNGKSVTTDTKEVWGPDNSPGWSTWVLPYTPRWPHQGIGKRVEF